MSEKIRETSQIQAYDFIPVIFAKFQKKIVLAYLNLRFNIF